MKKAPEAFRTISEVSELLETPAHVLRFWESKFYQIRPVKRAGGRRYYRPDDVALINGIRILLQDQGLTIRGAQRVLQERGVRHVIGLGAALPEAADELMTALDDTEILAESLPDDHAQEPAAVVPTSDEPALQAAQPALATDRPGAPGPARPRISFPDPDAIAATVEAEVASEIARHGPRLPGLLRQMRQDSLGPRRDRVAALARRIDALLDRMSEASGAGRW